MAPGEAAGAARPFPKVLEEAGDKKAPERPAQAGFRGRFASGLRMIRYLFASR